MFIFVHSPFRKKRLDEVCLEQYQQYSRSIIQSWILQGNSFYFFISNLVCRYCLELALIIVRSFLLLICKEIEQCLHSWTDFIVVLLLFFYLWGFLIFLIVFSLFFFIFIITYLFDDKCFHTLVSSFVAELTMLAATVK